MFEHHWGTGAQVVRGTKCNVYSGAFPIEEITQEIALLKKQMAEIICLMQQLVVEGRHDSSSPNQEGPTPQVENEARPLPNLNQGQTKPPFTLQGNNQEVDPSKDKTSESSYS